ncbi:exosome component 10 [Nasonia vitripennis]|uniref:Exosome complex component 10 homolog n=1 Tax=Nasonia vitripennis TaxID=7425 RepID=A0A7M7T6Q1_NASVI|nr:exosome component 10 [Nasonia vitripennis]
MTSEDPAVIEVEDSGTSISDFIQKSFAVIKDGIKASNSLPSADNFNYYTCFPTFNEIRNEQIKKILNSMQGIVERAGIAGNIKQRDIEEKFDLILESNDIYLDQAGLCMDEASGISKNPTVELIISQTNSPRHVNGSWNTNNSNTAKSASQSSNPAQAVRLLAAKNIQRPQLTFKDKIDNSQKPWEPKIKYKPNSLKPLAIYLECGDEGEEIFCHPYEFELDKFQPPEKQLVKKRPTKYKPVLDTPLIVIEKVQDLKILLEDLEKYNEIAVDLEHHSYRSFQGITCLMQISTKDTDYLIDTLTLRSELHVLNEIFTKPSILKVFHGADSDILWLQRDLGLYIVNMFDTYQAAKQLGLPFLSLSYLLKTHCEISANKHFQLADWRIRPLPEELMKYAREDTHYLLYIKDILSNALIDSANGQSNILKAVYTRSTDICKQTYTKPVWTENSYKAMYRKSQKMFNNRQLFALQELHKWRDETARAEDDSTNYVLPNHMLLNIAETLPREMQGILACCNPIPPLVRQNLLKIHKMILKAREQPLIKPILEDDMKQRLTQRNQVSNSESWIFAPHDTPSGMEAEANLPCLLNTSSTENKVMNETKLKPAINIFESSSEDEGGDSRSENSRKKGKLVFISPFERYKRVMPMIVEEERKAREKAEQEEAERIRKLQKSQQDTAASISRVHEHFVTVVQENVISPKLTGNAVSADKKSPQMIQVNSRFDRIVHKHHNRSPSSYQTLSQMPGKKRKRQLSPEVIRPFRNNKSNADKGNKRKRQ